MALLDLLGRRWVLWELGEGPLTFRALREATDCISPSVLNQRLADLREARVVVATDDGYALTPLGRDLLVALGPAFRWAERWKIEVR